MGLVKSVSPLDTTSSSTDLLDNFLQKIEMQLIEGPDSGQFTLSGKDGKEIGRRKKSKQD